MINLDGKVARHRRGRRGLEEASSATPLGRVATADDVAGPVLLLASDLARHG